MSTPGGAKFLKVREFCRRFGVSRDWVYSAVKTGRLPVVTFCGEQVRPLLIDASKAETLFSHAYESNVAHINTARSLKTKKSDESIDHKPVEKGDLWR